MKNKDKLSKPSSAGRVAGKGLSTKWSSYYTAGGRKEKKTSSESQSREVQELKAQVARIPEIVQEQVQQQLGTTLTAIVPTLIQGLTTWIVGGQQGPPPVPSFTASNLHNAQAAPLVYPAEAVFVGERSRNSKIFLRVTKIYLWRNQQRGEGECIYIPL